jgi:hypothetical protein
MTENHRTTRWEYRQFTVRTSPMSFFAKDRAEVVLDLNELGREGWEVAESYSYIGTTQYFILKRPVKE